MAKQSINMRLDKEILDEAKKILGQKETTATVEMALRNIINNRKAIDLFRKTSGKSKWDGFGTPRDEQ
jgi:antitoxin component of RelBE/YafQ-DinJ toxin-antitoxin module